MMVFSHAVWCEGVVVVVFVVVVCVCSLFVGVLVRCWVSGTTWLFWLITHVVFVLSVAGCVLVVLHGTWWLVCCVRTV